MAADIGVYPLETLTRICVYGTFDSSERYSRNQILARELGSSFSEQKFVQPRSTESKHTSNRDRISSPARILVSAWRLLTDLLSLWRQRRDAGGADCYLVPYPAYIDLHWLRLTVPTARRAPIVVDAFLCLHDTVVMDRKMFPDGGVVSRCLRWLERKALFAADLVLIDTELQRRRLIASYQLDPDKVLAVPVGIDESVWVPRSQPALEEPLQLLFWGTFIPLHGVKTILSAARILEMEKAPVNFTVIGDGQTADDFAEDLGRNTPKNFSWDRSLIPSETLSEKVAKSHCVLGIFGDSQKSDEVIPYKIYQAMASDRIFITRDSGAMRNLVVGEKPNGLFLVPPSDAPALADAILDVVANYARLSVNPGTRSVYDARLSNARIGFLLQEAVSRL